MSDYDDETIKETSPLLKVANILEKNGFRVIKAEEEIDSPHAYEGTIKLKIVPLKLSKNESYSSATKDKAGQKHSSFIETFNAELNNN